MANVVRDPKTDPQAILPDLATNTIAPFTKDDVALVYGSLWKQRYFSRIGNDYYVQPAQWDVTHKVWRKYFVENGTDWWAALYPPENKQRPTSALCDGCHSVGFDATANTVVEWNVGCERCHGPGSEHAAHPAKKNIANPASMDPFRATDTCVQCHSQGQPRKNPIGGRLFDWPVDYRVGLDLADVWRMDMPKLGEQTFSALRRGDRAQEPNAGQRFRPERDVPARRDVRRLPRGSRHGRARAAPRAGEPAQLRAPAAELCGQCHEPGGANGPRARTLTEHTGHAEKSEGSACIACHMPKIESTISDVRVRAHTFAFVPPSATDKYGIPNPCTSCHKDKNTAWAAAALARSTHARWRVE
jgi:hypothetical protein